MTILPLAKLSRLVYLFFNERCFRVRVRIDTYPNPNTNAILNKAFFKKRIDPSPGSIPTFYFLVPKPNFASAGISNNNYVLLALYG